MGKGCWGRECVIRRPILDGETRDMAEVGGVVGDVAAFFGQGRCRGEHVDVANRLVDGAGFGADFRGDGEKMRRSGKWS